MILSSATSVDENELNLSPRQFQLAPPTENPFVAMASSTVTRRDNAFSWTWGEGVAVPVLTRTQEILEDILTRSRHDVERFPKNVHARVNYGFALINRGRLEEAANEFFAALKIDPTNPVSMAAVGRIRILQGQFEEAQRLYEELASNQPSEITPLLNLAYIALRREDFDGASLILRKTISLDKVAVLPRFLMAVIYLRNGDTRGAIHHLRAAAKIDVRLPAVHQALGVAYAIAGDGQRAVRSFKTALTLVPNMSDAVRALSNILIQRGELDNLVELLTAYLEKVPDDVLARERLAEALLKQGRYSIARQQYLTALRSVAGDGKELAKQRALLLNNIGVCFEYQGDEKQAMQWFLRSVETNPAFGLIEHHNLAKLYIREGQFRKAGTILELCREAAPQNVETIEVQVLAFAKESRYEEAIVLLDTELKNGKDSPRIYADLGWLLTDVKHDVINGCKILTEGVQRHGYTPELKNNLAYAFLLDGRSMDARKVLESPSKSGNQERIENDVAITATWGLLHLWEENLEEGQKRYYEAEAMSRKSRDRHLPNVVRQKMHYELARYHLRHGDLKAATVEVSHGLAVRNGLDFCEQDLISLRENLENAAQH
jgi:tetratricopeptide (TPR) repeat protein